MTAAIGKLRPAVDVFAANRAVGTIALEARTRGADTYCAALSEQGSLRVRFPGPRMNKLNAVILNTAGGMAGGDRFKLDITAGRDARLVVTSAAAEKVYRSLGPDTDIAIRLKVAAGAALTWLPQEMIVFDRAGVSRSIDVELADGASLILAEAVVFGRTAMGEAMAHGRFIDRWRVRQGGKLIFAETVRLEGEIAGKLNQTAVAGGGVAIATALIVPGNEATAIAARAASTSFQGEVGASAWSGFAVVRFMAKDGAAVRHDLIAVLTALGAPLPRLWLN